MNCSEFDELLHDYLGGELPASQRAACEEHLADCQGCRSYLAGYAATVRMVKGAFPPPEFSADTLEELVSATLTMRFLNQFDSQGGAEALYFG